MCPLSGHHPTGPQAHNESRGVSQEYLKILERLAVAGNVDDLSRHLSSAAVTPGLLLAHLRSRGLLRASRYKFDPRIPTMLISHLRDNGLSEANADYVKSVESLLSLAAGAAKVLRSFTRSINAKSFKSYLASVDDLFQIAAFDRFAAGDHPAAMEKEQYASLFSYYYVLAREQGCVPGTAGLECVYADKIRDGYYLARLQELFGLQQLREAELHIDHFDYRARMDGNTLRVFAPEPNFERAYRLGYIRQSNQGTVDERNFGKCFPTMASRVAALLADREELFFRKTEAPFKRIQFGIPDADPFFKLLREPTLHFEEALELSLLSKELFVPINQLLTTHVYRSLHLSDLLAVQRLFYFCVTGLHLFCKRHGLSRTEYYYNSTVVSVFSATGGDVVSRLLGSEKTRDLLDLLTWKSDSSGIFDVQYQPIIDAGKFSLLPSAIIAASNVVRNTLQLCRLRFHSDGEKDPVADLLADSLRDAGFETATSVRYVGDDGPGEIDVVAARDKRLFVFECKNSLLPCSSFELRTSFDYIGKAGRQLDRIRTAFRSGKLTAQLAARFGSKFSSQAQLHTCIATGNRMFVGLQSRGHTCRPVFELASFLAEGRWRLLIAPNELNIPVGGYERKLWHGDSCTAEDLAGFVDGLGPYESMFASMELHPVVSRCGSYKIEAERWSMNYVTFFQDLRQMPHTFLPQS